MINDFDSFKQAINDMKERVNQIAGPLSVGKSKSGKLLIRRGDTVMLKATADEARKLAWHIRDLFGDE